MFIGRFGMPAKLTKHARERMIDRDVSMREICTVLESGDIRLKDEVRFWAAHEFSERDDNLICVAAVFEPPSIIVKTVMHQFRWEA